MDNQPILDTQPHSSETPANDSEISQAYYERYRHRREGLQLIRQLIELLSLIQQHRASSLAVLGGTEHFRQRTYTLQRSIHEKAGELQAKGENLDRRRWRGILSEWFTIKGHWHKDDPLDNFELHNFLIEQLAQLIWDTAKGSELMVDSMQGYLLSEFAFKHLIAYIESLGMLRGLSTYIASRGESSRSYTMRLSHLHRTCEDAFSHHRQVLSQLPAETQSELQPQTQTKTKKQDSLVLTEQFLKLVEEKMLSATELSVDSDEVFYHATRALEAELQRFNQVVAQLETTIKTERQVG